MYMSSYCVDLKVNCNIKKKKKKKLHYLKLAILSVCIYFWKPIEEFCSILNG